MTTPEDRLAMLQSREDLPEEVRRQLCKVPPHEWLRVQIIEVIREHKSLKVDEIIVGLWRKYKKVTTKRTVYSRLQELCDTGEIERVKIGCYKVKETT
jgi:Fe2+ or Zn2+ uptake regulation protein